MTEIELLQGILDELKKLNRRQIKQAKEGALSLSLEQE